jgi:5-methyltetrahydrofolate--homocysteine methyltransferase
MLIIGERINASRKAIAEAIASRDRAFIQNEAKIQAAAGADYIDINAGTFVGEEAEHLQWLTEVVQGVVDIPLCIDSPDPAVIKAVLPLAKKTPMINSITLERSRLEGILPLVVEYKAKIIGLCQSEDAVANTAVEKILMAEQLVEKVEAAGIPRHSLYIDPLVYPVATNHESALPPSMPSTIMTQFLGVHTTCGLTNVSCGLPARKLVNRTFLSRDHPGSRFRHFDPTDKELYGTSK